VNLSDDLSVVPGHINELPIPKIEDISTDVPASELEPLTKKLQQRVEGDCPLGSVLESVSTKFEMSDRFAYEALATLGEEMMDLNNRLMKLNLSLLDYIGSYQPGDSLAEVGFTQPPEGAAESILQATTKDQPKLRIGKVEVRRESKSTAEIYITARYKPDDEDIHETDRWGYTETVPLPALRITDLTETEANLVEHFVPVAVEEAGGFANFRETATQTKSLVDRLKALTLPKVEEVEDGLASYTKTKDRAEELEERIKRTDELINEIVYELYELTEEEIDVVQGAVGK
jgi:hypothetical protein